MAKTNNEMLNKYYELGDLLTKFISYRSIIQIDVDTALDAANQFEDRDKKLRFLGERYLDLADTLQKAGILK